MRLNGTEDLRVQKTIEAIHTAFEDMLLSMDYDKITVTALCARAKINKKTFYRYYDVLDVLLEEELEKISQGFLERIADYQVPEDLEKINCEFFRYSIEQGKLYERIICNTAHHAIGGKMIGEIVNRTWNTSASFRKLDKNEQKLLLVFINDIGVELYRQWVADGKKMPLHRIVALSNEFLCRGVSGFMSVAGK